MKDISLLRPIQLGMQKGLILAEIILDVDLELFINDYPVSDSVLSRKLFCWFQTQIQLEDPDSIPIRGPRFDSKMRLTRRLRSSPKTSSYLFS